MTRRFVDAVALGGATCPSNSAVETTAPTQPAGALESDRPTVLHEADGDVAELAGDPRAKCWSELERYLADCRGRLTLFRLLTTSPQLSLGREVLEPLL